MNSPNNPNNPNDSNSGQDAPVAEHPAWCSARYCTAAPERMLGNRDAAHRSAIVPLRVEATVGGATGMLTGQLQQAARRPGAGIFLHWLIGTEQVGQVRLVDAAPLALLIAEGLGAVDDEHLPRL